MEIGMLRIRLDFEKEIVAVTIGFLAEIRFFERMLVAISVATVAVQEPTAFMVSSNRAWWILSSWAPIVFDRHDSTCKK